MIRAEENNIPLSLSLQDLVDGLKADEKSIVILKYYQNLTFEEIADILDIPLGSAKSVLYRALKKLKHGFLKEEDVNG